MGSLLLLILFKKITYYSLWLTIFTMPFQKHFIVAGVGSINKLFGIILFISIILTIILRGKFQKPPLFYGILFLFIFLNLFSFYWGEVPLDALNKSLLYLQLGIISWGIYEFSCQRDKLNGLMKAFVLGCSVIALQSIYQFLTVGSDPLITSSRFFIEGYNPNQLGIIWGLGLPMAIYLIINGSKIFMLYIPIATFSILLTGSRTALVILIFAFICSIWLLFKYKIRFRKIFTFSLLGVGAYVLSKLPQGQLDRLYSIKDQLTGGTLNGRTGIWESGIETFKESPIFGVGSGSFLEASVANSETGIAYSAHNAYLSVLVENGIIGFMVFIIMLGTMFFNAYKINKKNPTRWLSLTLIAAWMILSFASHAEAQKYTWIVFGIIVTISHIAKNDLESSFEQSKEKSNNKNLKRKTVRKRIVW
ncbi:O-antigen ligase [Halomonas phage YPHTV-1]|nr:O-antigen ligase [Halomonas phage YPHTV-1]